MLLPLMCFNSKFDGLSNTDRGAQQELKCKYQVSINTRLVVHVKLVSLQQLLQQGELGRGGEQIGCWVFPGMTALFLTGRHVTGSLGVCISKLLVDMHLFAHAVFHICRLLYRFGQRVCTKG